MQPPEQDEGLLARVTLARVESEVQHDSNVTMHGALAQAEEALAELGAARGRGRCDLGSTAGRTVPGLGREAGPQRRHSGGRRTSGPSVFSPRLISELLILALLGYLVGNHACR